MEETPIRIISVWKKNPKQKIDRSRVMVQVVINYKEGWRTRHMPIDRKDPIFDGYMPNTP